LVIVLTAPAWVIGRDLWSVILIARRSAAAAVSLGHARARQARTHRRLDPITHDPFRDAMAVLARHSGDRATTAYAALADIERELGHTLGDRDGGAAGNAFRFHDGGDTLIRYGDPERAPRFLGPRGRDLFTRLGRVLDDVRLLHDMRIERAVMLFTFWGRALLLAAAPVLAPLTVGPVPLGPEATTLADVIWAVVALYACVIATQAPRLTSMVLSRSDAAQRLRSRLTVLEVPLATVLVIAFPAWPTAAFAAGWTNWWQRNSRPPGVDAEFSWPRLVAFVAVVTVAQIVGLAWADVGPGPGAVAFVVSLIAIAMVGGSYGAMLPLSLAVLVQTLVSSLGTARRARRHLATELQRAIDELHAAAFELSAPGQQDEAIDSVVLLRAADDLRIRASAEEQAVGRTPRELADLIDVALANVAPAAGSRHAAARADWAAAHGEEEPISFFHPNLPAGLEQARARDRKTAMLLRQVVERCAMEARAHGTGAAEFLVLEEDDEMVWRIGNFKRSQRTPGRGTGRRQLADLAARLGAGLAVHESIDTTFIAGTGANEIFGVEIRIPPTAFELPVAR
jgi:hypothetical protein